MYCLSTTVSARNSPFLSSKNLGTGNVLFQIASVYGIAKRLGRQSEFSSIIEYCEYIHSLYGYNHLRTLYRNCVGKLSEYPILLCEHSHEKKLDESLLTTIENTPNNIIIQGYLESPKYFHKYQDEILQLFSPDSESLRIIYEKYPELLTKTCIFIHIRVGADANVKCGINYYKQGIAYMNDRVQNPFYFVFSDGDVDVAELGLSNYKKVTGNPDYIDLWVMSLCKHGITCYSTFSWWGGYLISNPDKIITYPLSALKFIHCRSSQTEEQLHTDYFLGAVQIKDV